MRTSSAEGGTRGTPQVIVFIATNANTGRTSMVANLAWLMASAGRRVLAVDWGSESPTLHSYLKPFEADATPEVPDNLREAVEIAIEPSASAARRQALRTPDLAVHLHRYVLPGLDATVDVINCGELDSTPLVRLAQDGARDLRGAAQASGYDYILVDLPTTAEELDLEPFAELCDVAVVNFLPRGDGPTRAEQIVRDLHGTRDDLRVVAVPAVFDIGFSSRARHDSNLVRRTFKEALHNPRISLVEVPFRPQVAVFEALAVLVDEPGQKGTLAAAYERVADAVTEGAVTTQRPVPAQVRSRYRVALGMGEPVDTVWLAYAPQDRPWADWIAAQVRASGVPVARLPADGSVDTAEATVIAVLTPSFVGSPAQAAVLAATEGRRWRVIGVRVAADVSVESELPVERLELADLAPDVARRRLLSAAWIFEPSTTGLPATRMPQIAAPATLAELEPPTGSAIQQSHTDQPSPSRRFVGREGLLEQLRDRLCPIEAEPGHSGMHAVQVTGPQGLGKSELARAYAQRFAGTYERVWWIPAGDRHTVRSRLAELAAVLPIARSDQPAEAALAGLAERPARDRWLLVYDNAVPEAVAGLVPAGGPGDVIVTAVDESPGYPGTPLLVGALAEPDARALLRDETTGLRQLSEEDARRIGRELGYEPIPLILGAAWLRNRHARNRRSMSVEAAATAAARELLESLTAERQAHRELSPVHRMVTLTMQTMAQSPDPFGAMAVALARICVFVSPDGVSLRLLRSRTMVAELAALAGPPGSDLLVRDEIQLDRVLWTGVRFGLFEVDHGHPAVLRIHRVVQDAVRRVSEPEALRASQASTMHALAGYCSTGSESDPRHGADLGELQVHLEPSGATRFDLTDPAAVTLLGDAATPGTKGWTVRRWLVSQIRHMFQSRSQETRATAVTVADELSRVWTAAFGADDEMVGRLDAQRANLYRSLGDHKKAAEIDTRLLKLQRRELGRWHPRTLMTARGYGGDLRMLGLFEEALAEDEATWRGFRDTFGEDHPETLMVAHNLAISRQLMGRVPDACELERAGYERRVRVFGVAHPWTAESRRSLAAYLGELGRYGEALRHLQGNLDTLKDFHRRHEHSEELRSARVRLTLLRRDRDMPVEWIRKQGAQLLPRFVKRFGDGSNLTRACRLSHAVDVHADGASQRAIDLATESLIGYVRDFGGRHPFSSAVRVNLALFQHSAGQIDDALATGEQTLGDLRDTLDPQHPWALAAAVNHSCVLASAGQPEAATALLTATRNDCVEYLGRDHPTTVAAEHNLDVLRRGTDPAAADKPPWQELDIDLN